MSNGPYPLFSVMGIEIEYMLVDKKSLNIQPKSDLILQALAGKLVNEIALGEIAISNELVMHLLELKTNGPALPDAPIASQFHKTLQKIQSLLDEYDLQFIPSAAHPWMDPHTETKRWPHGNYKIYQQYDRIFDCKGHGWSNLQCMHVNLPFSNEEEFKHLHNSIRLLLPLLPAIAASSPFLDGAPTGMLDTRLDYYAKNQQRIPSIAGAIIPEFIVSEQEYQDKILIPMYRDISAFDKEGLLQYEWLNSRAAIAKFELGAIEIRILDSQEHINADIAIAKAIFAILKKWNEAAFYFLDNPCDTKILKQVYDQTRMHGLHVAIEDKELKRQWQLTNTIKNIKNCSDVWENLIEQISDKLDSTSQKSLETILSQGNLSERLIKACNKNYGRDRLMHVYRALGDCLRDNRAFLP